MADGWRIAFAGALAFLVVTALVPVCRRVALDRGITDGPAQGKMHRTPTPYLGGVAISVAAVGSAIVLPHWPREALLILAAAGLCSIAGLVDDLRGLRAATRLAIEVPAAMVAVIAGARSNIFGNGADFVVSVVFLVVLTNAFNLLDNMDGAAGAIGTTIAIALATTALLEHQVLVGGLAVVVAATCLGFLLYNWHPAVIFMGDAGSLFLGFLLAVIALMLRTRVPHPASALALLLLVGPALFDTTLVVISRTRAGRPIYIGGTDHSSHRLMLLGLSPVGATATLVAATALCGAAGVLVAEGVVSVTTAAPFVVVGAIVGLGFMLRVGVYKPARGRGELVRDDRPPGDPINRPPKKESTRMKLQVRAAQGTTGRARGSLRIVHDPAARAVELIGKIDERTARVVVVGMGYVGLPVAMRAVEVGLPVVGYDIAPERVDALAAGRSFVQDVTDEALARALDSGFRPTCDPEDLRDFDVAVITVQTPLRDGVPDLSYIEHAARELTNWLTPGALVVLESTTYPGTTNELLRPILEESGLSVDDGGFFCGYSPERIDPGNTEWTFVNTAKVVAGLDAVSSSVVEAFYGVLVDKVVPVASTAEAELVKLLENTFRHVNIALVNELAMFARSLDVDIWSAIDAAATKPYGFMRFAPGPGVGGHCLPVDPEYLAWRVEQQAGQRFRFVELANEVNRGMPAYVVSRIVAMLNEERRSVNGARILLLGLAYKPGSPDWREAPAMVIHERLRALGADVRVHDSHVPQCPPLGPPVERAECTIDELEAADLVVLCVDHPDLPYDDIVDHAPLLLDTRGRLRGFGFRGESL